MIQNAIWVFIRLTLSYRAVEEFMAECGVNVSFEPVRRRVLKFGPAFAGRLLQYSKGHALLGVLA
jgi:transposase-like protein